jgi:hypothetical protein
MIRCLKVLFLVAIVAAPCLVSAQDREVERKEQDGFPDRRGADHAAANMNSFLTAKYVNDGNITVRSGVRSYSKTIGNGPFKVRVTQYAAWATATWRQVFVGMTPIGHSVRWSRWSYQGGEFVQQGGNWVEYQNGRAVFTFREIGRSSDAVDLYDDSRKMNVRLTADEMHLKQPNTNWIHMYNGHAQ